MLNPPELPDLVKKEAAQSAFRMLDSRKSNIGDMEIFEDLQGLPKYYGPAFSDISTTRYNCYTQF
jgi:hypothetical protein